MSDTNEPAKNMVFSLFYLGIKENYESQEILNMTDGPFFSKKEAISKGSKKYGWAISDYAVVEVEQSGKVVEMNISN